jgi:hypothetical protein
MAAFLAISFTITLLAYLYASILGIFVIVTLFSSPSLTFLILNSISLVFIGIHIPFFGLSWCLDS